MTSKISIHALREEGDQPADLLEFVPDEFLSTPSARRATKVEGGVTTAIQISIHALREEGDVGVPQHVGMQGISIHALREEGDHQTVQPDVGAIQFLSTPSARRATVPLAASSRSLLYFYPRPPRGGRRVRPAGCSPYSPISIHALREEGDLQGTFPGQPFTVISIHALREEGDVVLCSGQVSSAISIHALREEGDH